MSNLDTNEHLVGASDLIVIAEEYLERMQEINCELEAGYLIQLACARALVGVGLEISKLNERLERWDDQYTQPGMRVTTYPKGGFE